eukprot:g2590.t1
MAKKLAAKKSQPTGTRCPTADMERKLRDREHFYLYVHSPVQINEPVSSGLPVHSSAGQDARLGNNKHIGVYDPEQGKIGVLGYSSPQRPPRPVP